MTEPLRATMLDKNYTDPEDHYGKSEVPPKGAPPASPLVPSTKDHALATDVKPAGVRALVDKFKTPPRLPPTSGSKAPPATEPKPTNTNSQRVLSHEHEAFHASAGKTSSGDSHYASIALLKGSLSGADAEVLGASLQLGKQNEVALTMGHSGVPLTVSDRLSVDAFTVRGNIGVHNNDGSDGLNVSLQATAVQFEASHDFDDSRLAHSGDSLSIAYSVGPGLEFSSGTRDADGDGILESCVRFPIGNLTVGACMEGRKW